jgi:integrase
VSKRRDGQGTITPLPDGRFWARAPRQPDRSRPSLGTYNTRDEADQALAIGLAQKRGLKRDHGITFAKFAETILDERELNGIRGVKKEREVFKAHLATAAFANMPLEKITPPVIAEWLRAMVKKKAMIGRRGHAPVATDRPLARSTIQRALNLLSAILDEACPHERNLIDQNPCLGAKVKKRAGAEATQEKEVFLTLDEQRAIQNCLAIPAADRDFILFAFGSGVRRGEQFNVHLTDVHADDDEPHVIVRFGANGLPTKNGKIYRVPLFGFALDATLRQLARLERGEIPNSLGLLWPTPFGHRRKGHPLGNGHFREVEKGGTHVYKPGRKNPVRVAKGKGTHVYVDRFKELLALAGITRRVRWHDLRHTCASALLQGQWGDAWTIQEVSAQLNHSSVSVTERYAHLGETAHKRAARKVRMSGGVGYGGLRPEDPCSTHAAIYPESLVEQRGIEPLTSALRTPSIVDQLRALATEKGPGNQLITHLASALVNALGGQS